MLSSLVCLRPLCLTLTDHFCLIPCVIIPSRFMAVSHIVGQDLEKEAAEEEAAAAAAAGGGAPQPPSSEDGDDSLML